MEHIKNIDCITVSCDNKTIKHIEEERYADAVKAKLISKENREIIEYIIKFNCLKEQIDSVIKNSLDESGKIVILKKLFKELYFKYIDKIPENATITKEDFDRIQFTGNDLMKAFMEGAKFGLFSW